MGTKEDWKAFRELRNRVKVALREAEQEYYDQEIHEKENNCGGNLENHLKHSAKQDRSHKLHQRHRMIHLPMNSITFLNLWERRQLVILQTCPVAQLIKPLNPC